MLGRTFLHIPGIGRQTERRLWAAGCLSWEDALSNANKYSFGRADKDVVKAGLRRSINALADGEHQYFARALKMREAWRAFPEFRHSCVYLDIETDGTAITMVGLFDGKRYECFVAGEDLGNVVDALSRYSLIVTFAGAMFDLPQMQKAFRNLAIDQIHIDLCPTLRELGIRGGLKKIEKQAGIVRAPEIDGLNGYDAVRLWRRWTQLREASALERLRTYNEADVVNLETLMEWSYPQLCRAAETGAHAEEPPTH